MNPAVHFISQAVVNRQPGACLPGVLEVEAVGFAPYAGFIEPVSNGRERSSRGDAVRKGRSREQSDQRIGKGIANFDVVSSAGGRDVVAGIRRAPAKRIRAVRIYPKHGGIAIDADLKSPFKRMRPAARDHVVLKLIDIPIRSENRAVGGIEALKQAVAKPDRRLGMVDGGEERRAAYVAQ